MSILIPLITILPGGNETDFALSLKALDRLLKLLEDLETPLQIRIVIGDGHHNAMGIYRYLKDKGIIPIIPRDEDSQPKPPEATTTPETTPETTPVTPRPQIAMYPGITFEPDGAPLCPRNCRMRHHGYLKGKAAHIFVCPCTRKNVSGEWIFHADECPFHKDCTPPPPKDPKRRIRASLVSIVYHDVNHNGQYDPKDEPGIPDVRIDFDDTTIFMTDADDQGILRQLAIGPHTVTLIEQSLPEQHQLTTEASFSFSLNPGDLRHLEFGVSLRP